MPSYINNINKQSKVVDQTSDFTINALNAIPDPTGTTKLVAAGLTASVAASNAIKSSITNNNGSISEKNKGLFGVSRALNPFSYLNGINNTNAFNKINGAANADKLLNTPKLPQAQMQQNYAAYAKKGRKLKSKNSPFRNQNGITKIKPLHGGIAFHEKGEVLNKY